MKTIAPLFERGEYIREGWANQYPDGSHGRLWPSRKMCNAAASDARTCCIRVIPKHVADRT